MGTGENGISHCAKRPVSAAPAKTRTMSMSKLCGNTSASTRRRVEGRERVVEDIVAPVEKTLL
jgi:hypothetical protein